MCIFYLSDRYYPTHKPSTSKYSVDDRRWNSAIGLKPALQHYILSFEQLFQDSNEAANGIHPILTIPTGPSVDYRQPAPGLSQSANGKNIQEVSYQEGSEDLITHTESSGFHFIEIHQGTVGAMLIFLMILGLLLCCLKMARSHHLRH